MESGWNVQEELNRLDNLSKSALGAGIESINFQDPNEYSYLILENFRSLNLSAEDEEKFQNKFGFLYFLRDLKDAFDFLWNKENDFLVGNPLTDEMKDEILKAYNPIVDKLLSYSHLWKDKDKFEKDIDVFSQKYGPTVFKIWDNQFQVTASELDSTLQISKVKTARFLKDFVTLAQQLLSEPQPNIPSSPFAKIKARATSFLGEEKSNPSSQLLENINSILNKPVSGEKKVSELHETLTTYKNKLSVDARAKVNTLLKYLEEHLPKDYQATIEKSGSNKVYDDLTQILTISSPPQSSWKNTANVFKSKIFSPTEKTDRSEYILSKTKEIIDNKTTTTEEQKLTAIRDLLNTEINNLDPSKQYPISLLISKIENMLPKVIPSGPTKRS